MSPESLELLKILLPYIAAAIVGFWVWWRNNQDDKREENQEAKRKQLEVRLQQDVWRDDKLAAVLEESITFLMDTVNKQLDEILVDVRKTATQNQTQEIANRLALVESKFTILIGTMAEIYDKIRRVDE